MQCFFLRLLLLALLQLVPQVLGRLECVNGRFKILQYTDTHLGESELKDSQTVAALKKMLSWEQPDFVALSGDIVTGDQLEESEPSAWPTTFHKLLDPIVASNAPWAFTFGNHDALGSWKRPQIIDFLMRQKLSYTGMYVDDSGGVSNYVITVWNNGQPAWNLWFLDSMDDYCYSVKSPGCVNFGAIEWYMAKSVELEQRFGRKVPGVMYVHQAIPELLNAWNNGPSIGLLNDGGIDCWFLNTGLFAAMVERGDVVSLWHGHNHSNDMYTVIDGVTVGFGRKAGFGGYGPHNVTRGARILQLDCEYHSWNTYVRQDDAAVIDAANAQHNAPGNWKDVKVCGH